MWQRLMKSVAGLVVIASITYACKNFLDQPAQGTVDQATLQNKVGVEGALVAAYRSLDCENSSGAWGCAASNWVWGGVTSNDAYKGSNLGDQNPIHGVETFQWGLGDVDGYLNAKWAQVYEGIFRANAALRLLDAVVASNPNEIGPTDQSGIRGEALFLRAHYSFEAYRMWGKIPYYFESDSLAAALGGYRKANDLTPDSVAGLIIADLAEAETLLPVTPRNADKGRATRWGALAYKGRAQAYRGDWAGAKASFDSVIASGVYALEAGYNRVWTADPKFRDGKETILAYQASVKDGEPNAENANFGERLNFPYGENNHFTCCGFYQPSYNLVNAFKVDAAGLPLSMSAATWNTDTITSTAIAVDPRLDWTVGRDNVPYKDWSYHQRSWIRDASYSGPFSPKKNIHEAAFVGSSEANVGWVATQTNNVPIHLFRYADMLLMDAEADVELNDLAAAQTIVNQIRARASVVAQGCGADTAVVNKYATFCTAPRRIMADTMRVNGAGVDTLTTPWANYRIGLYTTPWPDQNYARQAVRTERRLELGMEGQRFFDLQRWGIADTAVNNYLGSESGRITYYAGTQARSYCPSIGTIRFRRCRSS
jgi:hypothetical protein